MDGLNRAYEVKETRSFVKKRLVALGLTFGLAALTILGAALLVGSDKVATYLADTTHLPWMTTAGTVMGSLLGLFFMFAGLELVFYMGPNVKDQSWKWISPGSLIGVVIFVIVSFGFSQYLRFSNSYNATYGSIGGVIILMLWLYYLGLAIVIGGEVNSVIARAALARGNNQAPKVAEEKEEPKDDQKDGELATAPAASRSPYRRPVGYQPQLAFARSEDISLQAKKRIASRRLERNQRALEGQSDVPAGWSILKRPLVGMVYLGSIGFYLAQAFTKRKTPPPQASSST
jgi:membrane protein